MKSAKPSLGIAIMGVPERRERISRLVRQLEISDTQVAWDGNHDGHMTTWWRAVAIAKTGHPSHVLILEDDAEPCRDFIPAVQKLIQRYPDRIISFFSAQSRSKARNSGGVGGTIILVPSYRTLSDVAVVYPAAWLADLRRDFLAAQDRLAQTTWQLDFGADEMRIKLRPQQQVWNTVPSLVQHGSPYHSALGHKLGGVIAQNFIGIHASALTLDWSQA